MASLKPSPRRRQAGRRGREGPLIAAAEEDGRRPVGQRPDRPVPLGDRARHGPRDAEVAGPPRDELAEAEGVGLDGAPGGVEAGRPVIGVYDALPEVARPGRPLPLDLPVVSRLPEAHAATAQAKADRDLLNAYLAYAGTLVVVVDRQGRIALFNRAAEQVTGYRAEEVVGRPILRPDGRSDWADAVFRRVLSTGEAASVLAHEERTEVIDVDAAGLAALDVDNSAGTVTVVGVDGATGVTIRARISDGLRDTGLDTREGDGRLVVTGDCPLLWANWCRADLTIEVPADMHVTARGQGRVAVSDVSGGVNARSDQGGVELLRVGGTVVARSDQGRIDGNDLTATSVSELDEERSLVAREGWGARLLALQGDDGQWEGGAYFPARGDQPEAGDQPDHGEAGDHGEKPDDGDESQPWTATMPTLMQLVDLGVDPQDERVRRAVEQGATVLVASHELDRAESLAHRVVELAGGTTVAPARPAPGVRSAETPVSPTHQRKASTPSPPEVSHVA